MFNFGHKTAKVSQAFDHVSYSHVYKEHNVEADILLGRSKSC